jgi:transposase
MIQVDEKERIRRAYHIDGWSKRRIEEEMHHSRRTINKALDAAGEPVYQLHQPRPAPIMGPYQEIIDDWLRTDQQHRPKQRHTAQRIYDRLCDEYSFAGHESTVRRFVRLRRQALGKPPDVFLPLAYDPGQDGQCDWGEADVIMGGQQITVQLLFLSLCYSQAAFAMAFPHQRQEAFTSTSSVQASRARCAPLNSWAASRAV